MCGAVGEAQQTSPKSSPAPRDASAGGLADQSVERKADASDAFFASEKVVSLKIELAPAELQKLRDDNRNYVRCEVVENGSVTYKSVAIKLKGAAGSFREWDDRPALTLNMGKYTKKQSFHQLNKFHLNNSVQDEAYLNELLCSEIFRKAGLPVPRVTHARVWLNGRDVGLYVLKEGFDKSFLKRHFADASGNLYDGGFLQDIDVDLEKDAGDGPDDRSDLQALREACAESDPVLRETRLATLLDVDRFIDFMALELMTGHWDGYSLAKNNYRLYFDPQSKKAHFLAHGMDQTFVYPEASVIDYPGAIVASAVMHSRAWRKNYRARLKQFLPLFDPPTPLLRIVDTQQKRLFPVMREMHEDQANAFNDRIAELKQRLIERAANLRDQVEQPDPGPLEFSEDGLAELPDWYPVSESEDAVQEQPELAGQRATYQIKCGPSGACVASWRRKVLLEKGRYQLEVRAKAKGIVGQEDEKGTGAGVRVSGANRTNSLTGTSNWKVLQFEFETADDLREVELVAELRATAGEVWFEAKSLRLKRLPPMVEGADSK